MHHRLKYLLATFFLLGFLFSCSKTSEEPIYSPTPGEAEILRKLQTMSKAVEDLWPGYDYLRTRPIYLLHEDERDNVRGFLVNPLNNLPEDAVKVQDGSATALAIYQYDEGVSSALQELGPSSQHRLDFSTQFGTYNVIRTLNHNWFVWQYKNQDNNFIPMTLAHELFHTYQNEHWIFRDQNRHFEPIEFIWSQELIALQLLVSDLISNSFKAITEAGQLAFLKSYVSIKAAQIASDQSPNQDMFLLAINGIERIEGSARYIEHFAARRTLLPPVNHDPTYGWKTAFEEAVADHNFGLVLSHLNSRNFKYVGAGIVHLLAELGVDVFSGLANDQSPYDLAKARINLSDEELAAELERLKRQTNWAQYLERAQTILDIIN